MSIGDLIKQARISAELTQEDVAEKIGVSRQTISNWENGKSYPDISGIISLSDIYNLTLDSLVKGDRDVIEFLKESTDIVKSKKQVVASLISLILYIFGSSLIVWAMGGDLNDLYAPLSWLIALIPFIVILTVTRCFKLFCIGFQAAYFPKKAISYECRMKAILLYRLMTKTALFTATIVTLIALISILWQIEIPDAITIFSWNMSTALIVPLYCIILAAFVFEPVIFILKIKNKDIR